MEASGPVEAMPRDELDVAAVEVGQQPIAVELDLVQPIIASGHDGGDRGKLWLDGTEHRCPACAWVCGNVDGFHSGTILTRWRRLGNHRSKEAVSSHRGCLARHFEVTFTPEVFHGRDYSSTLLASLRPRQGPFIL